MLSVQVVFIEGYPDCISEASIDVLYTSVMSGVPK